MNKKRKKRVRLAFRGSVRDFRRFLAHQMDETKRRARREGRDVRSITLLEALHLEAK